MFMFTCCTLQTRIAWVGLVVLQLWSNSVLWKHDFDNIIHYLKYDGVDRKLISHGLSKFIASGCLQVCSVPKIWGTYHCPFGQ